MLAIVKTNVPLCPARCQKEWMHKGNDELCEAYPDFLVAVAKTGLRLSSKVLVKALKAQFEGNPGVLDAFAKSMEGACAWSRSKIRQVRDGSRLEPGLLAILKAWGWKQSKGSDEMLDAEVEIAKSPDEADKPESPEVDSEVEIVGQNDAPMSEESLQAAEIQRRALNAFRQDATKTCSSPKRRKLEACLTLSSDDGVTAKMETKATAKMETKAQAYSCKHSIEGNALAKAMIQQMQKRTLRDCSSLCENIYTYIYIYIYIMYFNK